MSHVFEILGVR